MEILTVSQASKYCKVSPKTIINWIEGGHIKAYKTVGGHRRIKKEDLDEFLAKNGMPIPEEVKGEQRKKILVVDDEPDVEMLFRQQFRRDLRAGRFTMEFAQSAPAALQRITDAAGASIILILSDINMPGMSGLELLPKAKAVRPDVPVIMITAYGDAETKRKALENGAEALFTKPIDFGMLRSEIDVRVERAA